MTTINESFNTADSDTLGPVLSWTELAGDIDIVSNTARAVTSNASSVARADSPLATVDHYVKAVVDATSASNGPAPGLILRKENNATLTFYEASINFNTDAIRIGKFVAGAFTSLASGTFDVTPGTPVTMELRVVGTALSLLINDVEVLTATDGAITAGTYTGLRGFRPTSGGQPIWDSFEAGDIAPAQVATPTIDPDGGSHETSVEITLACATEGATIYYTTDGSTPDATDNEYSAPFTLEETATVKAIGIKAAMTDSEVASADFTITEPEPGAGTAPRTNGIVKICLTEDTGNNRVPVRYVTWGDEQAVPVETVESLGIGVVAAVESEDANAVPVSEVEDA